MKLSGFNLLNSIEVRNAIIFCYKDFETVKEVYDKFKLKQNPHKIGMRLIESRGEDYPYRLIVEFFNRDRDIYIEPPSFLFEGTSSDEFRERLFLDSVDIKECKIIYSGDVVRVK